MVDIRLYEKFNDVNGKRYRNLELVFIDETGKILFSTQIKPSFELSVKQYGLFNHLVECYSDDLCDRE